MTFGVVMGWFAFALDHDSYKALYLLIYVLRCKYLSLFFELQWYYTLGLL